MNCKMSSKHFYTVFVNTAYASTFRNSHFGPKTQVWSATRYVNIPYKYIYPPSHGSYGHFQEGTKICPVTRLLCHPPQSLTLQLTGLSDIFEFRQNRYMTCYYYLSLFTLTSQCATYPYACTATVPSAPRQPVST